MSKKRIMKVSKEKTEKKPTRAVRTIPQTTPEEQALGTPANGYVVLFRLWTKAEHEELVALKDLIAAQLPEGVRPSWPAIVMHAMRRAA